MSSPDADAATAATTTKTALLVIHGIGQQDPFEALDSFARGFVDYFRGQLARTGQANTIREVRPVRLNHGDWTEVTLRLRFEKPVTNQGLQELHLHEYYWAPHTQGRVTYRAVLGWLIRIGLTPLRYLSQNLQAEWAASGRKFSSVGAVFARETLRIAFLYLPVLLLTGYLIYALATLPDLAGALGILLTAWKEETQKLPLVMVALAGAVATVLAWFMLVTAWRVRFWRGMSMQRTAEIAWFLQAGFWALIFLLLAGWVDTTLGPIGLVQTVKTKLSSWASAATFLRESVWPVGRTLLIVGVLLYLRKVLVEYVGDIAVYVTTDEKAEHYKARSQILKESTEALRRLLASPEQYDRVVVAGHSLGSVIAYDTINRLFNGTTALHGSTGPGAALTRKDLGRLRGLVTFGSPLDKVYYFFRRQVDEDQAIRAQVLSFLHGFRRGRSHRQYGPYTMTFGPPGSPEGDASSHPTLGESFRWLNVWARMDPVSGFLDHYVLDRTDQVSRPYLIWGIAHVAYWRDPEFYKLMAERLL